MPHLRPAAVLFRAWLFLTAWTIAAAAGAAEPQPPKGFTALFNGKDLTGWHGMPHSDPYKLAAMSAAERPARTRWSWRISLSANGTLFGSSWSANASRSI